MNSPSGTGSALLIDASTFSTTVSDSVFFLYVAVDFYNVFKNYNCLYACEL